MTTNNDDNIFNNLDGIEKSLTLELARLALGNMSICEEIAEEYDMSGEEISELRDKLKGRYP